MCKRNPENAERITEICEKVKQYLAVYDDHLMLSNSEIVNTMLTLDFLLRPAFHNDKDSFNQSLNTVLNKEYTFKHFNFYYDLEYFWVRTYIFGVRSEDITRERVDFAVPLIDEHLTRNGNLVGVSFVVFA